MTTRLLRAVVATALAAVLPVLAAAQPRAIPSPEQFFGFPMGAERKLAGWDRIVEYFRLVDRLSDRVLVEELGKTTMGRPYIMAIVSTPDTIADLPRYREMQHKLADPRRTSEAEAMKIAREGKAVLLIGTNVHSTEIGNSQMVNELIYRLATERSPWIDHVLGNVILLLIPSQNPDGQQMVVDWYLKNLGTPYEDSPLPELYHKYIGHDNNRDSYMLTQVETQLLTRVTYEEWLPEVYLDKHQMGSNRARIFVPPFKNPPNPNIDPLVWAEVNLLGQAMAARLHEAGKVGVVWGEQYTGFWQGANSTNPWWHNMVALLTEVASSRLATTLVQERADPDRPPRRADEPGVGGRGQERDPSQPLPPPSDVQYRMNYLEPWLGGTWSLADVVEYQLLSTLGLLEGVANNKTLLKRNFYLMNRRTIERFAKGSPYAYLVPARQRDPVAVAKLLSLIQAEAGEVHRAEAPFTADGVEYPAGTWVLKLAQPFGRWIKDLLEPQRYPDIRWPFPTAPIDRPYDVTAWSLGMLMGVETILVNRPFEARLALVTDRIAPAPGRVTGTGGTFVLDPGVTATARAVNRWLSAGADVGWAREAIEAGGRRFPPGAVIVRGVPREAVERVAKEIGLDVVATDAVAAPLLPLRMPRIALYEPWGGNMDAGWTRWLLEQYEFPYTHARPADLRRPDLASRFDVILLAEMSPEQIIRGLTGGNVRPEYRGGIGEEGVRHLREFVRGGGTIVTLGNTARFAIEQLGVPVENALSGLAPDAFFCPGSILRIQVDPSHPIGYGMPETADAMFINNGGYRLLPSFPSTSVSVVARYPNEPLLRSGWIVGDERLRGLAAVLDVGMGRGRVIMHTFRVQNRAQTWGTFKLLFNSLYYGPAVSGRRPAEPTAAATRAGAP
ncbi:MAG TPA: M14 metallopeptidase family protein [Vicinamibacterales bacterium]|nr:M14 metallopeptidase family protein [Vicinamibacterales bacterium]